MELDNIFRFKDFSILQKDNAMKVTTDGILLGAWCHTNGGRLLDIGTGTGVIALIIAHTDPDVKITAIEIDELSCLEAQHNVSECTMKNRIKVIQDSIQSYADSTSDRFDHIVSNPPFFSGGTLSHNYDKNTVRHTIKLSHSDLLRSVSKLLKLNGHFTVILPYLEGLRFCEMAQMYNLSVVTKVNVIGKEDGPIERLLIKFVHASSAKTQKTKDLIIRDLSGNYTDSYKEITSRYYMHLK